MVKDWSHHKFIIPTKQIITPEDVEIFKKTKIFFKFMTFIQELQKSVESKSKSSSAPNPKFDSLVLFLQTIDLLINEIPPLQQQMRFGNRSFRTWHERVQLVRKLSLFLHKSNKNSSLIKCLKSSFLLRNSVQALS